jgi:hypothetical protein
MSLALCFINRLSAKTTERAAAAAAADFACVGAVRTAVAACAHQRLLPEQQPFNLLCDHALLWLPAATLYRPACPAASLSRQSVCVTYTTTTHSIV